MGLVQYSDQGFFAPRKSKAAFDTTSEEVARTPLIARLRLEIEKLKRNIHGGRSERKARLLEQMELQA